MMQRTIRAATVILLSVAAGCGAPKTSDRDVQWVETDVAARLAKGQKKILGIAGGTEAAWVDPRRKEDYEATHIPGAINIPFQDISAEFRRLDGYGILIVYGADYGDPKADAMSKRLMELGFKDVRTLKGGLRAWIESGEPIETGEGSDEDTE